MKQLFSIKILTLVFSIITSTVPSLAQYPPDRPTFFEEGYRQLQREIQRLEDSPSQPEPLLTISPNELQWQQLISREGGFKVVIPAGITTQEQKTVETASEPLQFEVVTTNQPQSRFIVAYSNRLNNSNQGNYQQLFEEIRNFIVKNNSFQVTSDRPFHSSTFPGRSLTLETSTEKIDLRFYYGGDRIYVLGVSQTDQTDLSQAATQFFNSFQLLQN